MRLAAVLTYCRARPLHVRPGGDRLHHLRGFPSQAASLAEFDSMRREGGREREREGERMRGGEEERKRGREEERERG